MAVAILCEFNQETQGIISLIPDSAAQKYVEMSYVTPCIGDIENLFASLLKT